MIVKIIIILALGLGLYFLLSMVVRKLMHQNSNTLDDIYNMQDDAHRIFQKILKNQSDNPLIWDIGSVVLDSIDPRQKIKKELEKEINTTYDILQEAVENAQKRNSQEALDYITELEKDLITIRQSLHHIKSVTEIVKQLNNIKEDARLIAEQDSFDDSHSDDEDFSS